MSSPCRHQFFKKHLSVPTKCTMCQEWVWVWQGTDYWRCRLCKMNLHEGCYNVLLGHLERAATAVGQSDREEQRQHLTPHGDEMPEEDVGGGEGSSSDAVENRSITEESLLFLHTHELVAKRQGFTLSFPKCTQCKSLLVLGQSIFECASCDDVVLHEGCCNEFIETCNASSAGASGSPSPSAAIPVRILTKEELEARQHDANGEVIKSETIALIKAFSRRNTKWQLSLLNPASIPLLVHRHSELYDTCCAQLLELLEKKRGSEGGDGGQAAGTPPPSPSRSSFISEPELRELQEALRFATAVYGVAYREGSMTDAFGCVAMRSVYRDRLEPKDETNNRAVANILALPREAIKLAKWSYKTLEPSYCVILDHSGRQIVLCFRGSLSDADFLSDACATTRPFAQGSTAHQGMADMVDGLFDESKCDLLPTLSSLWKKYQDYRLLVTGHSLGGGLAQLFGVKLLSSSSSSLSLFHWLLEDDNGERRVTTMPSRQRVHVVGFAPPPVLSKPAADLFDGNITCVVGGNDIVCRLQLNAIDRLGADFAGNVSVGGRESNEPDDVFFTASEELNIVGRIWLLTYPTSKKKNRIVPVNRDSFLLHHVFAMPSACENHLMDHYAKGLRRGVTASLAVAAEDVVTTGGVGGGE